MGESLFNNVLIFLTVLFTIIGGFSISEDPDVPTKKIGLISILITLICIMILIVNNLIL